MERMLKTIKEMTIEDLVEEMWVIDAVTFFGVLIYLFATFPGFSPTDLQASTWADSVLVGGSFIVIVWVLSRVFHEYLKSRPGRCDVLRKKVLAALDGVLADVDITAYRVGSPEMPRLLVIVSDPAFAQEAEKRLMSVAGDVAVIWRDECERRLQEGDALFRQLLNNARMLVDTRAYGGTN